MEKNKKRIILILTFIMIIFMNPIWINTLADEIDFSQIETVEGRPDPIFKEYEELFGIMDEGIIIPGLDDEYIPQAITYIEDENLILTTHYDNNELGASVLAFTKEDSGDFIKYLSLYTSKAQRYKGHAGGIAISENYIWISSGENIYKFNLKEAIEKENGDNLIAESIHEINTRGSFLTYNDGILWAGEFSLPDSHKDSNKYKTNPSHHIKNRNGTDHKSITLGYELEDDTFPENGKVSYALSHGDRVQGITFAREQIYLSHSYGRGNNSNIASYKNVLKEKKHTDINIEGNNIPLWFLDNESRNLEKVLPPMSEGIVAIDDKLHIIFESGARKFLTVTKRYPLDRVQVLNLEEFDKLESSESKIEENNSSNNKIENSDEKNSNSMEEKISENIKESNYFYSKKIITIILVIIIIVTIVMKNKKNKKR